jgi:RNA polymerase sigma-70 factor (ECF subfamily)
MTTSQDPDSLLMERLQRGEDLALNALMDRWQAPLIHFIFRYIGDQTEALDLAQETFVRVYENRMKYKPGRGKFSTWLFTIASNLSLNFVRWQKRHPNIPLDPGEEGHEGGHSLQEKFPSAEATPWEKSVLNERAEAVRKAIQALPHDLRTTVLLFEYESMSYAEIASVLNCTPKAVETRLYRAREVLRKALGKL